MRVRAGNRYCVGSIEDISFVDAFLKNRFESICEKQDCITTLDSIFQQVFFVSPKKFLALQAFNTKWRCDNSLINTTRMNRRYWVSNLIIFCFSFAQQTKRNARRARKEKRAATTAPTVIIPTSRRSVLVARGIASDDSEFVTNTATSLATAMLKTIAPVRFRCSEVGRGKCQEKKQNPFALSAKLATAASAAHVASQVFFLYFLLFSISNPLQMCSCELLWKCTFV